MILYPRTYIFSLLWLVLLNAVDSANTTLSPIILPAAPGPYGTALKIEVMVDKSRPDPYNATEKYRRLLTSVYTPIPKSECYTTCEAQYMPPATAARQDAGFDLTVDVFGRVQLSGICCNASNRGAPGPHVAAPLLIWSPGFTESRLEWGMLAQYVASYGYHVVTVDHPGDAAVVEFPDGTIVLGTYPSNATQQQRDSALNIETQDVLFVLDTYTGGRGGANRNYGSTEKVGMIAHGAIAAQAMLNDSLNGHPGRIAGGVNLDGQFNGPILTEGIGAGDKSFLMWVPPSGPNNATLWDLWWNITDELDPRDWRKELSIANSTQGTLSDFPLIADLGGVRKADPTGVDSIFGTINSTISTTILVTYISAFFDMVLKGQDEPLLNGPSSAFPEVSFVRSS